ncbi:MAG: hypothetical protein L0332_26115 [Chloroflexi bacterium]|nr:hypothetical protein [Chloroflexota bacterium]MCI0647477.1 hypothetical protein [Chloroflexota bacterium]MCI0730175.1 hypothetical protein [Chloroflexota bacterium]
MTADPLVGYLFDDKPHPLTSTLADWLAAEPRYKAFVTTYKDKIRKKIRITRPEEGIGDLQFELAIAYWLAQERRFTVVYEPYASSKARGPDFAVTFKSLTFNVEVTRIRPPEGEGQMAANPSIETYTAGRLADTVGDKLRQMLPGMINVLAVGVYNPIVPQLDVARAMARLKERVEHKDTPLLARHGFRGTADFFKYYLRLSGVWVRGMEGGGTAGVSSLWLNNQAKQPIPANLRTILQG